MRELMLLGICNVWGLEMRSLIHRAVKVVQIQKNVEEVYELGW
jgi:hypothetical protein